VSETLVHRSFCHGCVVGGAGLVLSFASLVLVSPRETWMVVVASLALVLAFSVVRESTWRRDGIGGGDGDVKRG